MVVDGVYVDVVYEADYVFVHEEFQVGDVFVEGLQAEVLGYEADFGYVEEVHEHLGIEHRLRKILPHRILTLTHITHQLHPLNKLLPLILRRFTPLPIRQFHQRQPIPALFIHTHQYFLFPVCL